MRKQRAKEMKVVTCEARLQSWLLIFLVCFQHERWDSGDCFTPGGSEATTPYGSEVNPPWHLAHFFLHQRGQEKLKGWDKNGDWWEDSSGLQIKWWIPIVSQHLAKVRHDGNLAAFHGGPVRHTNAATATFVATHLVEQVVGCAPSASYKLNLEWTDQVLPSPPVRPPLVQKALGMVGPAVGVHKAQ